MIAQIQAMIGVIFITFESCLICMSFLFLHSLMSINMLKMRQIQNTISDAIHVGVFHTISYVMLNDSYTLSPLLLFSTISSQRMKASRKLYSFGENCLSLQDRQSIVSITTISVTLTVPTKKASICNGENLDIFLSCYL